MKICPKCTLEKADEEFSDRGNGTKSSYCKPCQREYGKVHYKSNRSQHCKRRYQNLKSWRVIVRAMIAEAKNVPCKDCGIKYNTWVMEFDHLGDKKFNIADAPSSQIGMDRIKKEIEKCEVVCANCHRTRTYKRKHSNKVI